MSNHQPRPWRRVLKIVLLLLALLIVGVMWLFNSEWFAGQAVTLLIGRANDRGEVNFELTNFSGSLADGLRVESLHFKQRNPSMHLLAKDIKLKLDWQRLKAGIVDISGSIDEVNVTGMVSSGFNSRIIPDYHGLACFAGMPANFQVTDFVVGTFSIQPWADTPLVLTAGKFKISPSASEKEQNLEIDLAVEWRQQKLGNGNFAGMIKPGSRKVEGNLEFLFAGQKLASELSMVAKKGQIEASGFIASSVIDLAKISQWLIPIWQDAFPFGFDGHIDCSGSWMFSHELGFLGNLFGKCRQLRMVALGLFISVVELNGDWKLFDGNLGFVDSGSFFLGFPASLTGQIYSLLQPTPKWELDFNCNQLDFAGLVNDLPWGLKYGMALPELSGGATLTLQLRNARPEIVASLMTSDLCVGKGRDTRNISGQIGFNLPTQGAGQIKVAMDCHSKFALPPLFQRFKGRKGKLTNRLFLNGSPVTYTYTMTGSGSARLALDGALLVSDQCIAKTSGDWHDGMGEMLLSLNEGIGSESEVYSAGHIPFLDLLLGK